MPVASFQRFGYLVGGLLIVSGVFHLAVYLVDGGAWGGPLSWRKPIVFGLSFGLTLLTVTWLVTFLRLRRAAGWLLIGTLGLASLGEVALISMQTWRGVPSHFNETTPFDGAVFSAMGTLVGVVVLVTVVITVLAFRRLDAPASLSVGIRFGLLLMLVSNAVGVQMIVEGGNTFGSEGALKLPHAVTLHAVQVLPALALGLLASESTEKRRIRVVGVGALGYALLIASTMVQTYSGRAPLDLAVLATVLAVTGLVLLSACAWIVLRGLVRQVRHPVAPSQAAPVGPAIDPAAH